MRLDELNWGNDSGYYKVAHFHTPIGQMRISQALKPECNFQGKKIAVGNYCIRWPDSDPPVDGLLWVDLDELAAQCVVYELLKGNGDAPR